MTTALRGLLTRLLLWFTLWSAGAMLTLPAYALLVIPAAAWVGSALPTAGARLSLHVEYPSVVATIQPDGRAASLEYISFLVLTYNAVLYLALVSAWNALTLWERSRLAALGLPCLFVFHVFDLAMAAHSRVLSVACSEQYDVRRHFSAWFILVKTYAFLSLMALKQALPVALLYIQLNHRGVHGPARRGPCTGPTDRGHHSPDAPPHREQG
jgi:hypothetical protein